MSDFVSTCKQSQREQVFQARCKAFTSNPNAGEQVSDALLGYLDLAVNTVISAYWPLAGELNSIPILKALSANGYQIVLPVMQGTEQPLIFRIWKPGITLVRASFNTWEPSPQQLQLEPDIILAPLLAFDRNGHRLGYGGGFYDRTLSKLRATKQIKVIGIAYAVQEVQRVACEPHDQLLDAIVTELEIIHPFCSN